MGGSALRGSKLVFAGVIGAGWIFSGAIAVAQDGPAAEAEMPAMKKALGGVFDERSAANDESANVQKRVGEISDETDALLVEAYEALATRAGAAAGGGGD